MKCTLFSVCILFLALCTQAQKTIDGLTKAERSFAAYAVANGVKSAFLQFADTSGVIFDQGRAVKVVNFWNAREERAGILNWRPDYVEIAGSHDFGYTTGPWTFQPNSMHDSITGKGRFITVWHFNDKNEWKFLVDLGVSNTPNSSDTILRKIEITDPSTQPGDKGSLLDVESQFISVAKGSMKDAYARFLSERAVLTRHGTIAAKTTEELLTVSKQSPQTLHFTADGSGIASSGDLGYVYGTILVNGKPENYLHIWRKEQDGWKLALEVLRL